MIMARDLVPRAAYMTYGRRTIHAPIAFYLGGPLRPWSVPRAALFGAGIGFVAALIRAFGPFRAVDRVLPLALDIGVAVLAFALLCVAAALLRNLLVRRLCGIWVGPDQTNRSK
jgi:hypothetical protein